MRLFEGTPFDVPPRCDRCGELEKECQCPASVAKTELIDPAKQTARITVEKRKKGKIVTVVNGLPNAGNDLPAICTQLKNACGAGGTVDGDSIEIQGQHAQRVSEILSDIGYRIKIVNASIKKK
jgi:translation initiation factor 1